MSGAARPDARDPSREVRKGVCGGAGSGEVLGLGLGAGGIEKRDVLLGPLDESRFDVLRSGGVRKREPEEKAISGVEVDNIGKKSLVTGIVKGSHCEP